MLEDRLQPTDVGLGELFFTARDAVVVGDAESGRIVLFNHAAEQLFGYTEDEVVGRLIEDLIPPTLRAPHRAGLERFVRDSSTPLLDSQTVAELVGLHRSGEEIDIELTLSPLKATSGSHYAMAIIRDARERKHYQKQLQEMNQTLKDFIGVAAHDMRTSLAIISGNASLIADQSELDQAALGQLAGSIERQAMKLSRLVADLLTTSMLEGGAIDVHPEETNLFTVAKEVIADADANESVRVVGDPQASVYADPAHVERMLNNYIANALIYGAPPITVLIEVIDRDVVTSVQDEGAGVPEEIRDELFQKFTRSAASRAAGGSGLGLSIVRGLARVNGGDAWYEEAPSGGAAFRVSLPSTPPR